MIKVEQREREKFLWIIHISHRYRTSSLRLFFHSHLFLSFSLVLSFISSLSLYSSLSRYFSFSLRHFIDPETQRALARRNYTFEIEKGKWKKKMIVHLFIQLFSYIYIHIYIYEIFIGYLDETLYLFRREYIGHGRNTIRRRDAITHITFTTNEPGDSFGR